MFGMFESLAKAAVAVVTVAAPLRFTIFSPSTQKQRTALEPTMRFRKKPVVVDAVKWLTHGDHPAVEPYSDHAHWGWINTLEGGHIVTPGDWIITGVKGEHYPCKPDIFALTYEPA